MIESWTLTKLSEILQPVLRPERVDPTKEFRLLGIRLDGAGPFHRETIQGSQSAATTLYQVKSGDFIYSRLFACRGAFGIIDSNLDGCYVSGEFPTFVPINDRVDINFLRLWFRLPMTIRKVESDCTGSTPLTRNRFKENFFLNLEIFLPPLAEQRRIVAKIDEMAEKIKEVRGLRESAMEKADALLPRSRAAEFMVLAGHFPNLTLDKLISMASGEGLTSSQMDDTAQYPVYGGGGLTGRYSQYLFEEPKIAIGRVGARCGCVFVTEPKSWITDNALYVTEISADLHPPYLVHALSTLDIRQHANQAAQPVVSQKKINPLTIPVPPVAEQQRIVGELDALQAKISSLRHMQAQTAAEIDALLPSILDKTFKGEL